MFVFGGVSYQIRILMHQCKVRHTQRIEPLRIFEHFAYCVFSTRIAYCVLANTQNAIRNTQTLSNNRPPPPSVCVFRFYIEPVRRVADRYRYHR